MFRGEFGVNVAGKLQASSIDFFKLHSNPSPVSAVVQRREFHAIHLSAQSNLRTDYYHNIKFMAQVFKRNSQILHIHRFAREDQEIHAI